MYQFLHAHKICPEAVHEFDAAAFSDPNDKANYVKAAKHVDQACGIIARGYEIGTLNDHEYDEVLQHIETAEELLEELGVGEDHGYLRDDLEARAAELLDTDSIDVEDEAEDFADEEGWLFGSDSDR